MRNEMSARKLGRGEERKGKRKVNDHKKMCDDKNQMLLNSYRSFTNWMLGLNTWVIRESVSGGIYPSRTRLYG